MKGTAATMRFLGELAEAKDMTDVNIAAGAAMQDLEGQWRERRRRAARHVVSLAAATLVCTAALGDAFASSPIQIGVSPVPDAHIFTRLGARNWEGENARILGVQLPWKARDGWAIRKLASL